MELKQIKPERVFVKPNFIESKNECISENDRKDQFVFAGRLDKLKGIDFLFEAWKRMGEGAPKLIVCGTGPMEEWCKSFIRQNDVNIASYVNSKLNENGMNPVTEKELLENRIDFNEHKIPHVEFVEFPEEMRSQYLLYAFPTMLKMAYEYCFITFGEKYLKNPIAMNIRDFLIKYDYKKDTEYCSPTIASLMWISEEERKISLKMYIDNDNIWVQIVLWGMILANICMLEEVFEDEMKIDSGLSVEM